MKGSGGQSIAVPAGVVLADKPAGMGSADLVARLKKEHFRCRVGHTGTLDRFASGLMLLVVGGATALANHLLRQNKGYRAIFRFGSFTDTHDPVGTVTDSRTDEETTAFMQSQAANIRAEILKIQEQCIQVPPLYSALKKQGRRYSDHAREGKTELPAARPIQVTDVRVLELRAVEVEAEFTVSAGTYIRAFARDLSQVLDFPLHLSGLRRVSIGNFKLEDSRVWVPTENSPELVDLLQTFPDWPVFSVDTEEHVRWISNGRLVPLDSLPAANSDFFIAGPDGSVLAWAQSGDEGYRYRKVFSVL